MFEEVFLILTQVNAVIIITMRYQNKSRLID